MQYTQNVVSLSITMFINTAIVVLLMNSNIFGFKITNSLISFYPSLQASQEQSQTYQSDFSRDWYVKVGANIITTWII